MKNKPIAILGGMGPEASAYLYSTLINNAIKYFGAKNNDDFPEILLYSIPVPDFISSDDKKAEALEMLINRVVNLNSLDLLCMCIACNTAHILIDELKNSSKTPFVSIIDVVVEAIKKDGIKKVGLLGTPSTISSGIYQDALDKKGIQTIIPRQKDIGLLEHAIRNVIEGTYNVSDTEHLFRISDQLKNGGARGIVLGCTEIPLIFPKSYSLPVYNSVEILSIALLKRYYS